MPERVEVTAVRNGGRDYIEVPTHDERWIAALLSDRAGYIAAGELHLIPGIDETLAYYGYTGELPAYTSTQKGQADG
jgi:hypothetical protein